MTPGTTYYACAIASNASGTAFGAVLSFNAPVPPTVITSAASAITNASATLNGAANPESADATGWFRFDVTNPGTCDDQFGTRVPASGGVSLGSGSSQAAFSEGITALAPLTTYYFCALASNAGGTATGSVLSLTTPSAASVTTLAATAVTSTTAKLKASAIPNGADTTGSFEYGTTNPGTCNASFGTAAPATGGVDLGSGASPVAFSEPVTGLTPGTTYYFCALASNANGDSIGTLLTFTTLAAIPVVTTVDGTPLSGTMAQLDGSANPQGGDTTGWFQYGETNPGTCDAAFGTPVPATGGTDLGSGNSSVAFSQPLSGLTPGTTYYVCAVASNSSGASFGAVVSFTQPLLPTVLTQAASNVTSNSATLKGSANPEGESTTGSFQYGTTNPGTCSSAFGTSVPASGGVSLGSGSLAAPFSQPVTGLIPGTTYYFCALASNAEGIATGAVLSFTTPAAPSATTLQATLITASTATLNATATPNGADTTGSFEYSATNPGSCSSSFGTVAPASGGIDLGSGTTAVPWSQAVTGLAPGTTYYFCALASNAYGTSLGAIQTFSTPALVPTVTTVGGTPQSGTTAQLDGTANPGGGDTAGWFRYDTSNPGTCDDIFGTRTPVTGGTDVGSGTGAIAFVDTISGLTPGATYYFCAIASNASGLAFGAVLSFTTPITPTVSTTAATSIASISATLNGLASPDGSDTTGWFRYSAANPGTCGDSFGTRIPATGGTDLGAGNSSAAYSEAIAGLSPATAYYFCALASNPAGLATGSVLSFTTPAAPAVFTSPATAVTSNSASLNGSANPDGEDTTAWFRYDTSNPGACNDSFGVRTPSGGGTDLGSGTAAVAAAQAISGLTSATNYYYCAIAFNQYGTAFGAVESFVTAAVAPSVTTNVAAELTGNSAQLDGSAIPGGAATTAWFRYDTANPQSCSDSFGTRAPLSGGTALGSGNAAAAFSQNISGLSPGATYYYCAIASNSAGIAFGAVVSFTTFAPPAVTTLQATLIASNSATLNGTENPGNADTTAWFRYDSKNPGQCSDAFGIRAPATGGQDLGTGSTTVPWAEAVSSLTPGTTYFYCALASNSTGLSFGAVVSFTTPAASPAVTTTSATLLTATGAQLNGAAIPDGADTTGWFRYDTSSPVTCSDAFGTRIPGSGGTDIGAGFSSSPFAQAATGLLPATTYFYCAIASNSIGTAVGTVVSFQTPASTTPPAVTSDAATEITSMSATLNGSVNPNLTDTTAWFRYSATNPGSCDDAFGIRVPSTGGTDVGEGDGIAAYAETLSGLAPGTTWYFCGIAGSAAGTSFGAVLSFANTAALPGVTTAAPTNVDGQSATLNGSVVGNGADTTAWFRFGTSNPGACDDTFGQSVPAIGGVDVGSGSTVTEYSEVVSSLVPGSTYFVCAIAANSVGTAFGDVVSFTPGTVPPTVTTSAATGVAGTSATLNGIVNPNGAVTQGWFQYGTMQPTTCSAAFGQQVPSTGGVAIAVGSAAVPLIQPVTGLTPGTTYYFCAAASSAGGAAFGDVLSFTTPETAPTVTTVAPTGISAGAATLNGTANPNGSSTMGWFRYANTSPGNCDDSFGTRVPPDASGQMLGAGTTPVPFSEPVSGLSTGTWYVCAIASNAAGTTFGDPVPLVVPPGPTSSSRAKAGCACDAASTSADSLLWILPVVQLALRRRRRTAR